MDTTMPARGEQTPRTPFLTIPTLPDKAYQQHRWDNIRLYGYNNRLMTQIKPLMRNTQAAYALFSPDGCLLKLTANEAVTAALHEAGICKGNLWTRSTVGRCAVTLGLSDPDSALVLSTVGEEHDCLPLKRFAVCFAPVSVLEDHSRPGASHRLYGGIALIVPAEQYHSDYNMLAHSLANDLVMHIDIGNTYSRVLEYGVDALLVFDINTSNQKIHTLYHSKNIFQVFDIPPSDIYFKPAELLFDPLPRNRELWQIIRERQRVHDRSLSLYVQGKPIHCIVTTDPYSQPKLSATGISFLITTQKRRVDNIATQISNSAVRTFEDIIGTSPVMQSAVKKARQIANSTSNVLIIGESGVGKDIFAQAIHNAGTRRDKPFVAINCGALPRDLIASELFGYEGGAFTGAKRQGNIGKFELANGGTLFLDEIGELPFDLQATLLRAVEQKKITRLGGTKEIDIDVRIISATNVNMQKMIEQKGFRSDLYYRLSTLRLYLPPLRDRGCDIVLLAEHFLHSVSRRIGRPDLIELSEASKALLTTLPWKGNIRELQNVFEGLVQLCPDSVIEPYHIEQELGLSEKERFESPPPLEPPSASRRKLLTEAEIRNALDICGGNRSKAANLLGIGRRTLYNNMERLGMDPDK